MIDVLVVGGGPAGLATAIRCAQAGLEVTVAEPRAAPIDKACGEGLMPAAVAGLESIGVRPPGQPLRGIRYTDGRRQADGLFRAGPGLGVRRTALHAALAERAAAVGVVVLPARVTGFTASADGVTAAGLQARYLVAADGLHSVIRRACALEPAPARHARYGLRRHYQVAPWSPMVEVHWAADAEAYVTPVAEDLVGVAILGAGPGDFDARLAAFPALRERLDGALAAGRVRGAGPLRQDVAGRVRGRVLLVGDAVGVPGRADRGGHQRGAGPGGGAGPVPAGGPPGRLRAGLAPGVAQVPAAHRRAAVVPAPPAAGPPHRPGSRAAAVAVHRDREPGGGRLRPSA